METTALLALMDLNMFEMYRAITRATPGGVVHDAVGLVLCGHPAGTVLTNMAMVAGAIDVPSLAALTEATFTARGWPFSVWTREHADAALEDALRRAGYTEITCTPGMALLPGAATAPPRRAHVAVRPVADETSRAAYADVMGEAYAVYGAPPESTRAHFARLESLHGPSTRAFLAWVDGEPLAGAALYVSHGVGGVGWVGTRPRAFGRGLGAAVTWEVVQEGLRRRVRCFSLQASPMGAAIYARIGFTTPTRYRVFIAP